jgi:excisionase family DNA binding protein
MNPILDRSFTLQETVRRYEILLREGMRKSKYLMKDFNQSASSHTPSLHYFQELEEKVTTRLNTLLERWRQNEIQLKTCLHDVEEYCSQQTWANVFIRCKSGDVRDSARTFQHLGYCLASAPTCPSSETGLYFEPFGIVSLKIPPLFEFLDTLKSIDSVHEIIDADCPVQLSPPPETDFHNQLSGSMDVIDPERVREQIGISNCGKGIRVCVIDTGIDFRHPDLDGSVESWADFTGEGDGIDHNGHGTHVAGIIGSRGRASQGMYGGVAPGVTLLAAKVLDREGSGSTMSVLSGLRWALDQQVDVVNVSLGGSGTTDGQSILSRSCDLLAERGIVVVVSAGNSGPDNRTIGIPGDARNAITVGALSRSRSVCGFSSRGPTDNPTWTGIKPDLIAPGERIVSCLASDANSMYWQPIPGNSKYAAASGTSMAAPMVSGVVAVLLGKVLAGGNKLDAMDVKPLLQNTCTRLPDTAPEAQGNGSVNLSMAVQKSMRNKCNVSQSNMDEVLSVEELADYLKIKTVTLYKLLREGQVPAFKIGATWRFRESTIDEWIAAQEQSNSFNLVGDKKGRRSMTNQLSMACSLCGKQLKNQSETPYFCQHPDCHEPICIRCWEGFQRRTCIAHRKFSKAPSSSPQPSVQDCGQGHSLPNTASPQSQNREEEQREKRTSRWNELLSLESAFIERVKSQFAETESLPHPSKDDLVSFAGCWTFLEEKSEEAKIIQHPQFSLDPSTLRSVCPVNRSLLYQIKIPRGVVGRSSQTIDMEICFWNRWEDLLENPHSSSPRTKTELTTLLNDKLSLLQKQKKQMVLALFSPSGWESDAIGYVVIQENQTQMRFASPLLSVILLGPSSGECWYESTDARASLCAPLLQRDLPREAVRRCCQELRRE